ncbi:hypothetical protein E3E31_00195 [Thermococcus sp. M39]|uniref:hypothetical protein n=1 Tax=unclassified Thermococcus TaxID=2627626 RepID=UPI00143A8E63|nr:MULTISPECIES: hypothetical protein [unclassified Thermococcus]NJE06977.1 hypothetical protein [Thermococcus sp. M39]NJE12871.1 hypothetical protein [Thermococcus sp. LS2]
MSKIKFVTGGLLIILGSVLTYYGGIVSNPRYINFGIAGIFLGLVVISLVPSKFVRYETFEAMVKPYLDFSKNFISNLALEGKAVYIPPYENLPKGGTFISLKEDFDLDLGRLDEETVFLTNVSREKEMGLLITPPLGYDLAKKFEEYSEIDLQNTEINLAITSASSVLKTLDLVGGIDFEENNEEIVLYIENIKPEFCREVKNETCEKLACPICSSILFAIAKSQNELIKIESIKKYKDYTEVRVRRLGGVEKWM